MDCNPLCEKLKRICDCGLESEVPVNERIPGNFWVSCADITGDSLTLKACITPSAPGKYITFEGTSPSREGSAFLKKSKPRVNVIAFFTSTRLIAPEDGERGVVRGEVDGVVERIETDQAMSGTNSGLAAPDFDGIRQEHVGARQIDLHGMT